MTSSAEIAIAPNLIVVRLTLEGRLREYRMPRLPQLRVGAWSEPDTRELDELLDHDEPLVEELEDLNAKLRHVADRLLERADRRRT